MYSTLLGSRLPRLAGHLLDLGCPISLFSIQWFMCLFAKDLPLALTLRVWDVFFVYGDHALFAVGLVMMQMGEARVLSCRTLEEVYDELKAMGTGLQQRDAEAAHRLVTASLEALMNTALIDLIETTRLESRAQLLREAEEAAAAAATAATEAADAAAHAADAPPSPLPPLRRHCWRRRPAEASRRRRGRRRRRHRRPLAGDARASARARGGGDSGGRRRTRPCRRRPKCRRRRRTEEETRRGRRCRRRRPSPSLRALPPSAATPPPPRSPPPPPPAPSRSRCRRRAHHAVRSARRGAHRARGELAPPARTELPTARSGAAPPSALSFAS